MKKLAKIFRVIFLWFISASSLAQNKVTYYVKPPSLLHSADHLYIAGNFNLWNPADKNFQFQETKNGIAAITISLPSGNYEYKFTRGDWSKAETTADGTGIANRTLNVSSDTIININISGWNDDFALSAPQEKKHSASVNVTVMDSAFFIPQFNRTRRIWLYLPPDYASSKKLYPVLYMHDGQNLFDNATSFSGEWGVDEFLDSVFSKGKKEFIVVGIDNGLANRMNEYNPWKFKSFGNGQGDQYVDFLVKTLKPFIDKNYHTLRDKKNTFIAGSSMGGLISMYAVLKYPLIFGGAGIFSPAFWTASGVDSTVISKSKKMNSKLFFYAGGKEGDRMVPDMMRIENEIKKYSVSPTKEIIDPDAKHNEAAWKKWFPAFYDWIVANE
ncbi:MAG: alpha/beta hydrolase-fold protein [Bacteroidota bacterium]|nr:alpha/beta hydrolase-fold protein [Bacteroidota bacterium]